MRASLSFLLLLGACASSPPSSADDAAALARAVGDRAPAEPRKCISPLGNDQTRIIDDRTIVYGSVGTIYVNRLERPCPGLRPTSTLIVHRFGSQLCRNDRIRSLDPGSTIPGAVCLLGDFIPYRLRD